MLMNQSHYKYSDITQKIIGCAMSVPSHFGLGFPEAVYKRSLLIELEQNNIKFRKGQLRIQKICLFETESAESIKNH